MSLPSTRSSGPLGAHLAVAVVTLAVVLSGCTKEHPASPDGGVVSDREAARVRHQRGDSHIVCPYEWLDDGMFCDHYCDFGCTDPDCARPEAVGAEACHVADGGPAPLCGGDVCGVDETCCCGTCTPGDACPPVVCPEDGGEPPPLCALLGDECIDRPCCGDLICNGESSTCFPRDEDAGPGPVECGGAICGADESCCCDVCTPVDVCLPDLCPEDGGTPPPPPEDGGTPPPPPEDGGPAPTDCRTTGCDDGYYCDFCWVGYDCIPDGAVC